RSFHYFESARDFDKINRLDDADAPSSRDAMDRLRELQVWIHARRFVDKPCAQMKRGLLRITLILRDQVCGCKRRNLNTQAHQRATMLDEVVRVRHAVALNVRATGILWIGPPVIALREKVMQSARAARTVRGSDCDGCFSQILICRFQDARAIKGRDVEAGLQRARRPITTDDNKDY